MLQRLNESIQGFFAWIIIGLIIITFALFGVEYYIQAQKNPRLEVTVDGESIAKDAFELSYRRIQQQRNSEQITAENEKQIKQQLLNQLIINTVLLHAAKQNGFVVFPSQADLAILSIPQFRQDGYFSEQRYKHALSTAWFTPETFQKEVQQGMWLNQQKFAFMGTAFALPEEVRQFVKLYMQTRSYDYAILPLNWFITNNHISEEKLKVYYNSHANEFTEPEKAVVEYVELSLPDIKKNIHISDKQIKQFYEDNKGNYYTPPSWRVARVVLQTNKDSNPQDVNLQAESNKIKSIWESMDALKNIDKLDNSNAYKVEVLPWMTTGQSSLDFVFKSLKKTGDIVGPIKTPVGYAMFRLIAYKPGSLQPLKEVSAAIEAQLVNDQAQAIYASKLEQLSDLSYQYPDSLEPIRDALHININKSKEFTSSGNLDDDFTKSPNVIKASFSHDVYELGNNSEPIQYKADVLVVLRVAKKIPAKLKDFATVRNDIIAKIQSQDARLDLQAYGKKLLKQLETHDVNYKQLVGPHNEKLNWKLVASSARELDDGILTEINDLAFDLKKPNDMVGEYISNDSYVLVKLKHIIDGDINNLDNEQASSIAQQIETNYGLLDYELYVNYLLKNAKVKRY